MKYMKRKEKKHDGQNESIKKKLRHNEIDELEDNQLQAKKKKKRNSTRNLLKNPKKKWKDRGMVLGGFIQ